jgi:hypothetical protein
MYTSQGPHITDALTIAQIQGMHTSQGTHITYALTIAQIQGMHTSQGTHITDALTICIIRLLIDRIQLVLINNALPH